MRIQKLGIVLAIGLFLVAVSLVPVASHATAAAGVETGDYWKYEASADLEGMSVDTSMKMKVTGTEGSGASEVFVIKVTGYGEVSGSSGGFTVSGDVEYSGEIKRLKSNFSMVSNDIDIVMSMKASGMTMKMTLSMQQTYSPAIDDYIGDNNPGHGGTIVSRSNVTTTTSMKLEMTGFPVKDETSTTTNLVVQTIQVAATNESVSVPAGTFDCYKYTCSIEMGGSTNLVTFYHSDEVGNYVKQEGSSGMVGAFGDSELKSYSFGGKSSSGASLFSGTNLLIIIVVIVAVLVIISLVLMMRKRGKAVAPMPAPLPETYVPPPPPPGT